MGDRKYSALGDGDLTPEQLEGMDLWDRDVMLDKRHRAIGSILVRRAVAEIRRHRAEDRAARANLAAVGVAEDGPIGQLVCTLAGLYLELQQKARAAQTVSAERVREAVREAAESELEAYWGTKERLSMRRLARDIADRVAARLATTPDGAP